MQTMLDAEDVMSIGTTSEMGSPAHGSRRVSIVDPAVIAAAAAAAAAETGATGTRPAAMRRCATNQALLLATATAQNDDDSPRSAQSGGRPMLKTSRSLPVMVVHKQEAEEEEEEAPQQVLVYIERIPADASARMIHQALESSLGPIEPGSLDIIRKHKTRHCHGFALLACAWPENTEAHTVVLPGTDEEVRVLKSDLPHRQRAVVETPTPRQTLRLRVYAQRKLWLEPASRLTWAGVLAVMKDIAPELWEGVVMLADDMKKKKPGSWAHPAVLLGAYFADCGSAEAAEQIKDALHDQRACIDGVFFLVEAQFTCELKHLHEKGKQTATERRFAQAKAKARSGEHPGENFAKKRGRSENDNPEDPPAAEPIPTPPSVVAVPPALRKVDSGRSTATSGMARTESALNKIMKVSPPGSANHSPVIPTMNDHGSNLDPCALAFNPAQQSSFMSAQPPPPPPPQAATPPPQQMGTPYQQPSSAQWQPLSPVSPVPQMGLQQQMYRESPGQSTTQQTPGHSSLGGCSPMNPPPLGLGQPQLSVFGQQKGLDELLQENSAFRDMFYMYFSEEGRQRFREQWFKGGCHGFNDMVNKLQAGGIFTGASMPPPPPPPPQQQPQQHMMPQNQGHIGSPMPGAQHMPPTHRMPHGMPASPAPLPPNSPAPNSIPTLMMSPMSEDLSSPKQQELYLPQQHMQQLHSPYTFSHH